MKKNLLKEFFSLATKPLQAFLILAAWLLAVSSVHAQTTVSGTVVSGEDSSPLPGVNILVKGTANGTITDASGRYSINVPSLDASLVFSFVG